MTTSTSLTGIKSTLMLLGLQIPDKHRKNLDEHLTLLPRLAATAPSPDEVVDAMDAALKAGKDPLDTDTGRRYLTSRLLVDPDILQVAKRREQRAVDELIANAMPDVIEHMRPNAEEAGSHIAHAVDTLGESWHTGSASTLSGVRLAAYGNASEALATLKNIGRVWSTIIEVRGITASPTHKWLIFSEPDADHIAYQIDRVDALWPVRKGRPVEMATLDTLADRAAKAEELKAAARRRDELAQREAATRHLNKIRY